MKTFYFIFLSILVFACQNQEDRKIPQQPEARKELYQEIAKNEESMNEFMDAAMETENGRSMMDAAAQKSIDSVEAVTRLLQLCLGDTSYCNMVSEKMMDNRPMMENMMNNMYAEGMIDEDCLENGMGKMK